MGCWEVGTIKFESLTFLVLSLYIETASGGLQMLDHFPCHGHSLKISNADKHQTFLDHLSIC